MQGFRYAVGLITVGLTTASASAAISANLTLDTSLPGVVQHIWTVDTDSDFTAAVYLAELSSGSVHNPFTIDETLDGALFGFPGDTFVTANGNPNTEVNGPASDLGGLGPFPGFGPDVISVTWSSPGIDLDDIGTGLPIGRFSFSDDAFGTWQLLVTNAAGDQTLLSGIIIPEPASLSLLTLGGLALLRRQH